MKPNKNLKKTIYLNEQKKLLLWENIQNWIQKNEKNVRILNQQRHKTWETNNSHILKNNNNFMFKSIIAIFTILFTSWVTFAAQASIPWDFFYPVKIHINENFQTAVAFTPENIAKVEIYKIEERIKEKDILEKKWELTPKIQNYIFDRIELSEITFYEKVDSLDTNVSLDLQNQYFEAIELTWPITKFEKIPENIQLNLKEAIKNNEIKIYYDDSVNQKKSEGSIKIKQYNSSELDFEKIQ